MAGHRSTGALAGWAAIGALVGAVLPTSLPVLAATAGAAVAMAFGAGCGRSVGAALTLGHARAVLTIPGKVLPAAGWLAVVTAFLSAAAGGPRWAVAAGVAGLACLSLASRLMSFRAAAAHAERERIAAGDRLTRSAARRDGPLTRLTAPPCTVLVVTGAAACAIAAYVSVASLAADGLPGWFGAGGVAWATVVLLLARCGWDAQAWRTDVALSRLAEQSRGS